MTLTGDQDAAARRLAVCVRGMADSPDLPVRTVWERVHAHPDSLGWVTTEEVVIDGTALLVDRHPAQVDVLTPQGRQEHPDIAGVCAHLAAHITAPPVPQGEDPRVRHAAALLGEVAAEAHHLRRRPQDRDLLRAAVERTDLHQFSPLTVAPRWAQATAVVLLLGRVEAGVLDSEEVRAVRRAVDPGLLRDLGPLLSAACSGDDLHDLATACAGVVGDSLPAGAWIPGCTGASAPPGQPEWHEPQPAPPPLPASPVVAAARRALAAVAESRQAEADEAAQRQADQEREKDRLRREQSERAQQRAAEKRRATQRATRQSLADPGVFDLESITGAGGPPDENRLPYDPPTARDRTLARMAQQMVRRLNTPDTTRRRVRSEMPPGRLDTREAVLRSAQRAQGSPVTARPFTEKRVRHAPRPPSVVGVMCDVSGSMTWAQGAVPSVAWALSQALHRERGRVAAVLYGCDQVHPLTWPGIPDPGVAQVIAHGGGECFGAAFDTLDDALGLTVPGANRLLVVVSDGAYSSIEVRRAKAACQDVLDSGGTVLWAFPAGGGLSLDAVPPQATRCPVQIDWSASWVGADQGVGEAIMQALDDALTAAAEPA